MSKHCKKPKPRPMGRIGGLVLMSMGAGMLVVLLIPGWGFLLAAGMVIAGFWLLFF